MTKVEYAEQTLYEQLLGFCPEVFFVGVGKHLSNEIVLIVYLNTSSEILPPIPEDWEGFRVVTKDASSMLS